MSRARIRTTAVTHFRPLTLLALGTALSGCLINTSLRDERLDAVEDDDACEDGGDPSPEVCDGLDNDCDGVIDNGPDADGDGIADICDVCEGADDGVDTDGDGTADGCDTCPLDAAPDDDDDGDGVCNSDDVCPGGSDVTDLDSDGTADGCDTCPRDAGNDIDQDGQCANVDNCPSAVDCVWLSTETMARPQDVSIRAPQGSSWHLGTAALRPTDLTGDGIPDLVVSAGGEVGGSLPGRVWIIEGPLDHDIQLLADAAGGPQLGEALAVIEGLPGDRFGAAIDLVPDQNGDGIEELLVGAPDSGNGRIYLIQSPFSGVMDGTSGPAHITCETAGGRCGEAVLGVEVLPNPGDPAALFFSGSAEDVGWSNPGAIGVLLGPPPGTGELRLQEAADAIIVNDLGYDAVFGLRLTEMGDLNGDGIPEVAVSAPAVSPGYQQGTVCVIDPTTLLGGGEYGLSSFPCWTQDLTSDSFFGSAISRVPDLDGDGHRELLIGDSGVDGNSPGNAFLLFSNGLPLTSHSGGVLSYDGWFYDGTTYLHVIGSSQQELGHAVAATDIDADGEPELLLAGDEGITWAIWGSDIYPGYNTYWVEDVARVRFARDRVLGRVITPAGDINGDGFVDFLLGDPGQVDGSVPQGEVLLVWGANAP